MRTITLFLSTLFLVSAISVFSQNTLPEKARNYIKTHFPEETIANSKKDWNDWDVYLKNGIKMEFSLDGDIKEIEGKGNSIPTSVLPEGAASYIQKNYPIMKIKEIEFKNAKIEVDLENGTKLIFDKSGRFIKMDD